MTELGGKIRLCVKTILSGKMSVGYWLRVHSIYLHGEFCEEGTLKNNFHSLAAANPKHRFVFQENHGQYASSASCLPRADDLIAFPAQTYQAVTIRFIGETE